MLVVVAKLNCRRRRSSSYTSSFGSVPLMCLLVCELSIIWFVATLFRSWQTTSDHQRGSFGSFARVSCLQSSPLTPFSLVRSFMIWSRLTLDARLEDDDYLSSSPKQRGSQLEKQINGYDGLSHKQAAWQLVAIWQLMQKKSAYVRYGTSVVCEISWMANLMVAKHKQRHFPKSSIHIYIYI